MNEASILYFITIVIISSFKLFNKNGFNMLNSIIEFNDYHVKQSIVIPMIHFIYSTISNMVFGLLSGNLRFAKVMDIIYNNLSLNQHSFYGIIIYSFEILMYFLIGLSYVYVMTEFLTIVSNIHNGDSASNDIKSTIVVTIMIVSALFLHSFLTKYLLNNYKNKESVLVDKFIDMIKKLTIFATVMYILIKIIQYKFNDDKFRQSQNFANIEDFYKNTFKLPNLEAKFDKIKPVGKILKNHALITILIQGILSIFFRIGYMKNYNVTSLFKKQQILFNVILLISNTLLNLS